MQYAYSPNLDGDLASATNGAGTSFTYGYVTNASGGIAGQLASVTSSLSDAQHPAALFSGATYNPLGGLASASYGNGTSETDTPDDRGRITAASVTGNDTHASGSITVNGTEQIKGTPSAGTGSVTIGGGPDRSLTVGTSAGSGSVAVSGSERTIQHAATPGTGWVAVGGGPDDNVQVCYPSPGGPQCHSEPDSGELVVTVNGHSDSTGYGPETDDQIATNLASAINSDSAAPVTASASGSTVYLTAKTSGASTNYSLSTSSYSTNGGTDPFWLGASGSSLTGGTDVVTYYDSGTLSLAVNGQTFSTSYGQSSSSSSLASALASAVQSGSSYVNASASGSTVNLVAKTNGASTNYSLSASSATTDTAQFSGTSFPVSASGSTLTGGANTTYYDSGTVSLTANGQSFSAGYGQSSTTSSLASALASAVQSGSSYVSASASGSTVDLTAKTTGASTNYSLSATSATGDSSQFSGSSFSATASGSSLTGGGSETYDSGTVTATVNGVTESASYGQGSTASSIASALAGAFSGDSAITASASGATVTFTSTATGWNTNYGLSAGSATNDPGDFPSGSFSASPSGSALTGGATASYSFSVGYAPDGDVTSANDSINGDWTSFQYDPLNRLVASSCTANCPDGQNTQGFSYVYDRFGNRWQQNVTAGSGPSPQLSFDANNRIATGVSYDASGELTSDGTHTYQYDAEGRLISVDGGSTAEYVYNAQGQRVQRTAGGQTFEDIYDLGGRMVAEMAASNGGWQRGEVFAAGRHVATYTNATTYFPHTDWLGTERVRAAANGSPYEACASLWYGDGLACQFTSSALDPSPLHFTGKERDAESGLDDFGARYSASTMGRFMSPDLLFIDAQRLTDPQSLNLYSYVRSKPLDLTDDTGLDFYLACRTSNHSGCGQVQNGDKKIWVQGQGTGKDFQAYDIDMNRDGSGLFSDQFGNDYQGTFDQNGVSFSPVASGGASGSGAFIEGSDQTDVNGSGLFSGLQGHFISACGGSCEARGSLTGPASAFAEMEGQLSRQSGLMSGLDLLSGAHNTGIQWKDSSGFIHVIQNGPGTRNAGITEMHFEGHPTGVDVTQFVLHMVDTIRDANNGTAAAQRNLRLPTGPAQ